MLAAAYPELTYVEGFVVLVTPGHPDVRIDHAWNETADGQVVDSTWEYPDQARRYERAIDNATKASGR